MQTKTFSRLMGGVGAAALVALGMATTVPHMRAQDPAQQQGGRIGRGPGGPGGPGMGRGRGGPGGPGSPGGMMMLPGLDPRDLTQDQRDQIKSIRDAHAADIQPAMEHLQKAREALDNAVLSGLGDVRGLALELGMAEGEFAFQQAQVETAVMTVLTAEQKQKIQDRRKEMEARRAEMEQRRASRGAQGNSK